MQEHANTLPCMSRKCLSAFHMERKECTHNCNPSFLLANILPHGENPPWTKIEYTVLMRAGNHVQRKVYMHALNPCHVKLSIYTHTHAQPAKPLILQKTYCTAFYLWHPSTQSSAGSLSNLPHPLQWRPQLPWDLRWGEKGVRDPRTKLIFYLRN